MSQNQLKSIFVNNCCPNCHTPTDMHAELEFMISSKPISWHCSTCNITAASNHYFTYIDYHAQRTHVNLKDSKTNVYPANITGDIIRIDGVPTKFAISDIIKFISLYKTFQ